MLKAVKRRCNVQGAAPHRRGELDQLGRVAAQVVYYFKGYFAATKDNRSPVLRGADGDFGNIYAGSVARQMGLPIMNLILASNRERRSGRVFQDREVPVKRKVTHTTSPSMDISKASNFERYVYELVDRDPARVKDLGGGSSGASSTCRTRHTGRASRSRLRLGKSRHHDRISTIRMMFERYRLMIDRTPADGVKFGSSTEPLVPLICLRPRCRRSSPPPCARRSAASPSGRASPGPLERPAAALHPHRARCRRRQALYCLALMNERKVLAASCARAATTR